MSSSFSPPSSRGWRITSKRRRSCWTWRARSGRPLEWTCPATGTAARLRRLTWATIWTRSINPTPRTILTSKPTSRTGLTTARSRISSARETIARLRRLCIRKKCLWRKTSCFLNNLTLDPRVARAVARGPMTWTSRSSDDEPVNIKIC